MQKGADQRRGRGAAKGAPNAGRPPSVIRASMRDALDRRLSILSAFADDDALPPVERMRALEMLAKYGIGTTTTATDADGQDAPTAIKVTHHIVDAARG